MILYKRQQVVSANVIGLPRDLCHRDAGIRTFATEFLGAVATSMELIPANKPECNAAVIYHCKQEWRMWRRIWNGTDASRLLQSQQRLLARFVKTPFVENPEVLNSVRVSSNLEYERKQDGAISFLWRGLKPERDVLLLHGFGSGLGFYFSNYDAIANMSSVANVYGVDWLGMGGSERPSCHKAPRVPIFPVWESIYTPPKAVDFFIDSLEAWRNHHELKDLVIVGHSLGGYLAARFCLKYPDAATRLILVSPVGISAHPSVEERIDRGDLPWGLYLLDSLWSVVTPQQVVRIMGWRGLESVKTILRRRFSNRWDDEDTNLIAEYLYHITVAKPSGEYAMNSILMPIMSKQRIGIYAREPLFEVLRNLENVKKLRILYGDNDWLATNAIDASQSLAMLQEARPDIDAKLEIIPNAGHHLYLDNPKEFHQSIQKILL